MPSKKKKYNARFPAGRIKKIMQTDEEVGKVAQAVPVIISRTLELFVESLLTKTIQITNAKNAKILSPSHMKQCILAESRFDFLKDLVKTLPDATSNDTDDGTSAQSIGVQPPPATTTTSKVKSRTSISRRRSSENQIRSRKKQKRIKSDSNKTTSTSLVNNNITSNDDDDDDDDDDLDDIEIIEDDDDDDGDSDEKHENRLTILTPNIINGELDEDYDT